MSGLNVENFNLFAKKPAAKPIQRPVATVQEVVEAPQEMEMKNEINLIKEMNATAQMTEMASMAAPVEIERFEEIHPTTIQVYAQNIETRTVADKNKEVNKVRKFETFATPTFRIPLEHDLELKRIEQTIMRNRKKGQFIEGRERITSNTVIRALLANFIDRVGDMDLSNIDNEEMLKERMEKIFKQKYNKRT
jgi:hypothetical protein